MEPDRRNRISQLAAVSILAFAIAAVVFLVLNGGTSYRYTLRLATAGQLVEGNEVRIGGPAVGTIESVELADDYIAEIGIAIDRRLPEGSRAVIRTTSQSGIANRYVAILPGPEGGTYIQPGSAISQASTTTSVDFDQLLASFGPRTREGLRKFIRGSATVFRGRAPEANETFRYLWPALAETRGLLAELVADREALERFAVQGGAAFGALADRRDDLASLVTSAETALTAIAAENRALSSGLSRLPGTISQATTTLAALRDARADLDPLVVASLDATGGLTPFLRQAKPVLRDAVPVFADLRSTVARPGAENDLAELLAASPAAADAAGKATPHVLDALEGSQHIFAFARPYAPDLLGWLAKFGQASAYYDANGHYARVAPANANIFSLNPVTGRLEPIYSDPSQQLDGMEVGVGAPCPGAATGPAIDGSNPFTDHGRIGPSLCDPAFVPPGS